MVVGLQRQVDAVQAAIDSTGLRARVHGCFCFINPRDESSQSGIPLLRTLRRPPSRK
jgi:hypothetical protein